MILNSDIQLAVADGSTLPAHQAQPAGRPAAVGVVVAHELFGVNPDITGVVNDLAAAGYLAIAPEFYHRHAAAGRWLPRDDAGRTEGFELLHRMNRADALADVSAAIDHLRAQPGISAIAMIGFSAGGHLAYLAASQLPIDATVVLYGGWLPTTDIPLSRPEPTLSLTTSITGRVLYLVGDADALIDASQRDQIGQALNTAQVDHELVSYPGVLHAYFWPDTAAFDQRARDDSWNRILALLAQTSVRPADR